MERIAMAAPTSINFRIFIPESPLSTAECSLDKRQVNGNGLGSKPWLTAMFCACHTTAAPPYRNMTLTVLVAWMRRMIRTAAAFLAAFLMVCQAPAGRAATAEPSPPEQVLTWMKSYRAKPERKVLPEAVHALAASGAFQEPDAAGVFVGFMAGVIGSNPQQAEKLVGQMLTIKPEDNWAVVRAVAYSGHPEWRTLLAKVAHKAPNRQAMVDAYLNEKLPTLDHFIIKDQPSMWKRMFKRSKPDKLELEPSPVVMDTFWGYYYATGSLRPLSNIVSLLPWAADLNDAGRLTLGSTAKYSLAHNSSRDAELLTALKEERVHQPKEVVTHLDEVIFAAETAEIGKLKSEAAAALNELRMKGPSYKRKLSWWGKLGEGAISLGCVTAAVTGQVQLGIPCVIGGATYSGVLRYLSGS
jgi:hypothetical protein